jgi:competence protein ComEA
MADNQIKGLIAVIVLLTIIPFTVILANIISYRKLPVLINQDNDTLTIEIQKKNSARGIYFTPRGTSADQLLQSAGLNIRTQNNFQLKNTMSLIVDESSLRRISLSIIDNSRKLALGLPVDLNLATEEDLLLIPGIGEVTAKKILEAKSKKIHFARIEELMEIEGIKEKKLAKLRLYLYVNNTN